MNRYFKFGIPVAAILGTLVWIALSTPKESMGYFKTIPEVKHMGEQAQVKHLKLSGYVKEGSIAHEGTKTVFLLVENPGDGNAGDNLKVVYSGDDPLPDTFKDRAQAVADGKLDSDGIFHATQIQAKCASKYEGATPPPVSGSKPTKI